MEMLEDFKPEHPLEGPLRLRVTFGFKAPRKSELWKWKLTRPDTDNSIKTLKDVMTALGFWIDDSQVVCETCKKMYVDHPGIVIQVQDMPAMAEEEWPNA